MAPLSPSHAPYCAFCHCDFDRSLVKLFYEPAQPLGEKQLNDAKEVADALVNLSEGGKVLRVKPVPPSLGARPHEVGDRSVPPGSRDTRTISAAFTFAYPFPPPTILEAILSGDSASVVSFTYRAPPDDSSSITPTAALACIDAKPDAEHHGEAISDSSFGDASFVQVSVAKSPEDCDVPRAGPDSNPTLESTPVQSADVADIPDNSVEIRSVVRPSPINSVTSHQLSVECGALSHFKIMVWTTTSLFWLSVMSILLLCDGLRRVARKPVYSPADD
ncbi:hypothetical protein LshimejAT787_2400020 [Lyophyllum shimeji]|uniref:Uncharacterized protein n=1 Tax=Lyophyllum shimeji TaxID=47721 RepID=A0A9P3Q1N6_LYOSH|nr:hypothetical protein LshimejAT787_2400020 [Lyophyllum shimeji]